MGGFVDSVKKIEENNIMSDTKICNDDFGSICVRKLAYRNKCLKVSDSNSGQCIYPCNNYSTYNCEAELYRGYKVIHHYDNTRQIRLQIPSKKVFEFLHYESKTITFPITAKTAVAEDTTDKFRFPDLFINQQKKTTERM